LRRFASDAGFCRVEVVGVDFARREMDSGIVRGNGDASASHVRIQHALAGLRELREQPLVETHRLLCGVDSVGVRILRAQPEGFRGFIEARPCELGIREGHAIRLLFVPDHEAPRRRQWEVVSTPHDLILRHPAEFREVFRAGHSIVGLLHRAISRQPSAWCPVCHADAVRRIDDCQIEVTIREGCHHVHAIAKPQIQRPRTRRCMEHGGRVLRDFEREGCRVHDLMRSA